MVARGHQVHLFCPKLTDPDLVRHKFKVQPHEFTLWKMGRYAAFRNFKYTLYPFALQSLVENQRPQSALIFPHHAIAAVTAGRLKQSLRVPCVMNFLDYLTAF